MQQLYNNAYTKFCGLLTITDRHRVTKQLFRAALKVLFPSSAAAAASFAKFTRAASLAPSLPTEPKQSFGLLAAAAAKVEAVRKKGFKG